MARESLAADVRCHRRVLLMVVVPKHGRDRPGEVAGSTARIRHEKISDCDVTERRAAQGPHSALT